MTDRIARWRQDHGNFAQLLGILERQLDVFNDGGRPNYRLMLDVMHYMIHYPDGLHCPAEDLAFAKVAEIDPSLRPVADALIEEHHSLLEKGEALVRHLEGVLNDEFVERKLIAQCGLEYAVSFRRHMHREEEELFPTAAKCLRAEDWAQIDRVIALRDAPMYTQAMMVGFSALRHRIAADARTLP